MDPANDLINMDEKQDPTSLLYLEGKQVSLLGLNDPKVGTSFNLTAVAKLVDISETALDDGQTVRRATLQLSRVLAERDESTVLNAMFPSMVRR